MFCPKSKLDRNTASEFKLVGFVDPGSDADSGNTPSPLNSIAITMFSLISGLFKLAIPFVGVFGCGESTIINLSSGNYRDALPRSKYLSIDHLNSSIGRIVADFHLCSNLCKNGRH